MFAMILVFAAFVFLWMPLYAVFGKPGPTRRLFRFALSAIVSGVCFIYGFDYLFS